MHNIKKERGKIKSIAVLMLLVILSGMLTACGSETSSEQDSYSNALFVLYACTNPTEPMHYLIYDNFRDAFDTITDSGLKSYLYNYYQSSGELPESVNLITDVKNQGYNIPDGITSGVITFESDGSLTWNITASITMNGFTSGTLTYYGDFQVTDMVATLSSSTGDLEISSGTLSASQLTVMNSSEDYSEADYETFSVKISGSDENYPTLTINGYISVYSESSGETITYGFSSFYFVQTSTGITSISGNFSIDDVSYTIGGSSISRDSSFCWTSGTVTITAYNEDDEDNVSGYVTLTVTFDGTEATFSKTSDEWTVENWCSDRLAP